MWKEVGAYFWWKGIQLLSAEIDCPGCYKCVNPTTGCTQYTSIQKYEPFVKLTTSREHLWRDNGAAGGWGRWCHYLLFGHVWEVASLDAVQNCFHKLNCLGVQSRSVKDSKKDSGEDVVNNGCFLRVLLSVKSVNLWASLSVNSLSWYSVLW